MRGGIAWGIGRLRPLAGPIAVALALALPTGATAQTPPPITVPIIPGFHSVLAQGEGRSITATDLAQNQATGEPPDSFVTSSRSTST